MKAGTTAISQRHAVTQAVSTFLSSKKNKPTANIEASLSTSQAEEEEKTQESHHESHQESQALLALLTSLKQQLRVLEEDANLHSKVDALFPDCVATKAAATDLGLTNNIETQHMLLGLLAAILGVWLQHGEDERLVNVPENAEQLLNVEGIEQLCQFVAWCHIDGVLSFM